MASAFARALMAMTEMDGDDDGALGQDADGRALAVGLPGHGQVANVVLAHRQRRLLHAGNESFAQCR